MGKITDRELIEWASGQMASYKCPRTIEFRDSLTKGPTGKVAHKELKENEATKRAAAQ